MHQLNSREAHLTQQISALQRDLCTITAAGHDQGTVGVDPEVLVARNQSCDALMQNLSAVEEQDEIIVELSLLVILKNHFHPGANLTWKKPDQILRQVL
jgi:senataxin